MRRVCLLAVNVALLFGLTACSTVGNSAGYPISVGRNLVATIDVLGEKTPIELMAEQGDRVLEAEIIDVRWVGRPELSLTKAPPVRAGDRLDVVSPPKFDYQVGERYSASFSYLLGWVVDGELVPKEPMWWLNLGVDDTGRVITNRDPDLAQETFRSMDEVDGDEDTPADLLSGLAAEWEAKLNARDRGVPDTAQPVGPLLAAAFEAAGVPVPVALPTVEESVEAFVAAPPEYRVFPTDEMEATGLTDGVEKSLGVPLLQLEAMVLHDRSVGDAVSLGLWFIAEGRTAETFIDRETGVTIISSVAPVGIPFEVVGYPRDTDPGDGSISSNTEPRKWDRSFGRVAGIDAVDAAGDGIIYMTIDLRSGPPEVKTLTEEEYFQLVMDMQDVLDTGAETGEGPEPD